MRDDYPAGLTGIEMVAGRTSDGTPVREEEVRDLGERTSEVRATPGLVDGIAFGDVIRDLGDGRLAMVRRGGHLAIQVWGEDPAGVTRIEAAVTGLAGWRDGGHGRGYSVFTVPGSAGFPAVEQALDGVVAGHPALTWNYGNVYADPEDPSTALNWWL